MIVQTDKYSFKLKFKQIGTVLNESFSGLAPFNFAQSICVSRRVQSLHCGGSYVEVVTEIT